MCHEVTLRLFNSDAEKDDFRGFSVKITDFSLLATVVYFEQPWDTKKRIYVALLCILPVRISLKVKQKSFNSSTWRKRYAVWVRGSFIPVGSIVWKILPWFYEL